MLEEQARRARKLQGDRLGLDDFAQFLNLPVTDTLTQVHSMFDQVNTDRVKVQQSFYFIFLNRFKISTDNEITNW